jgi:Holliday junction resolvase
MKLKNPKAKGARAERKIKAHLQEFGAYVIKAGGSLGVFDLVSLDMNGVFLVQVKCNRMPGKTEMKALTDFKTPSYASKWLAVVPDRGEIIWTAIR